MRTQVKIILLFLVLVLCLGCRTKVQTLEVEHIKTEYQDRLRLVRDSIYLHDSVYIAQRGDTIYHDRWRTRYKEVTRLDTAYIERRDSIRYPVIVEVEKPRHWLFNLEINFYRLVALLFSIYALWHTIRTYLWRRRV